MTTAHDEVLTSGSQRPPLVNKERLRRWLLVALLVTAALVAAVALDQWQRHREMDALLDEVQAGEQSITAADQTLSAVVSYYSPVIFRPDATKRLRTGFREDLARAAGEGAADTF